MQVEYLDWSMDASPERHESRGEGTAEPLQLYVGHEDGWCNPGLTLSLARETPVGQERLEVFLSEEQASALYKLLKDHYRD